MSEPRILSLLSGVRRSGAGWVACCPAHDDRRASLSVSVGSDGKTLLHCHAGCPTESIVKALGLAMHDLMPDDDRSPPKSARSSPKAKRQSSKANQFSSASVNPTGQAYPTAHDAICELERKLGPRSAMWVYHDVAGQPVGVVVRWDKSGGKEIRPIARRADGWHIAAMPEPRPLYGLPELLPADPNKPVVVVEGEKCADAARSLGFLATTSAGGSQAADKTDWGPLRGRRVIIIPDYDKSGQSYADDVGRLVTAAGAAEVRILRLWEYTPRLAAGDDLADVIADPEFCGLPVGDSAEPLDLYNWILHAASRSPLWGELPTKDKPQPDVQSLVDVEPCPVPWLWPGRIPLGRITLLVGRPGAGKSFFTCDLAARLSRGEPWPVTGDPAPVGDTLLICAEDDPADTIRPRLDGAGADCRRIHLLRGVRTLCEDGQERTLPFDLSQIDVIRRALDRLPNCKLVVIDPIGSFLGSGVDAHRDNEVRAVLTPLAALAAEKKVAILIVCHTRKSLQGFADDMTLGSRAFVGLARSVLHLGHDPHDRKRKLLLPGKNNLAPETDGFAFRITGEVPRIEWEPEPVSDLADDLVGRGPASPIGRPREERSAAAQWLAELLQNGPMPASEIRTAATGAGLSWSTVRRAQEELGIIPERQGFGANGAWMWGLPIGAQNSGVLSTYGADPIGAQNSPDDPHRCSEPGNFEHLWENKGKNTQKPPGNPIGAQNSGVLSTYGADPIGAQNSPDDPHRWPEFGEEPEQNQDKVHQDDKHSQQDGRPSDDWMVF